MTFEKIVEREREMFYAKMKISQKRDLVNSILRLCDESYLKLEELSKDFPKSNLNALYDCYNDKIKTLRGELKEDNTLTEDINKTLQEVLNNVKSQDYKKYAITKLKLESLIDRTWN